MTPGPRRADLEENRRYALLRLGLGCNAACLFCNVPWEQGGFPLRMSTQEAKRAILGISSCAERLDLSGGEPTLRPDLEELISRARASGIKIVELQTNGILLRRPRIKALRLAGLTHAFVGLHSQNPKLHDFLVRFPGAFKACLEAVRGLLEEGLEVTLNPVVTALSFRLLPGYMEFAARALPGLASVSLSVVQPHGRAWRNRFLLPRYGELSPFVELALEKAGSLGLLVNNPYCGLPLCIGGWHRRLSSCVEYCEAELGRKEDAMKFHPQACSACFLRSRCGGVWRDYPALHPLCDLRPVPREVRS